MTNDQFPLTNDFSSPQLPITAVTITITGTLLTCAVRMGIQAIALTHISGSL